MNGKLRRIKQKELKHMKYSQQIKERQEYTGFLAKQFYKDLIMELERLEQIEQAQEDVAQLHDELNQVKEEYAVIMELHHERI
jgi:hypothetical protein